MFLYLQIARFRFLRHIVYPIEVIAVFIRNFGIRIGFLVFFWTLILEESDNKTTVESMLSYFLLASSISSVLMMYNTQMGRVIRKHVKKGDISQALIKPVGLLPYFYSLAVGDMGIQFIFAIASFTVSLIINPPTSIISILLFILFFIEAFAVAFSLNLFEGALSLVFTEVSGIKNSIHHISRLLSGSLIPLSFFPETVRNIILLTPFPVMINGPISALSMSSIDAYTINTLVIGGIWAISMNLIIFYFWKRALRFYDAIGI